MDFNEKDEVFKGPRARSQSSQNVLDTISVKLGRTSVVLIIISKFFYKYSLMCLRLLFVCLLLLVKHLVTVFVPKIGIFLFKRQK
jgi:hypothetical protein